MPFRPAASCRKKISHVIYPLTASVARRYGIRRSDGAYPIGAFYDHISDKRWRRVEGIWYQPIDAAAGDAIRRREINESDIALFMSSITTGEAFQTSHGTHVTWEPIASEKASQLP